MPTPSLWRRWLIPLGVAAVVAVPLLIWQCGKPLPSPLWVSKQPGELPEADDQGAGSRLVLRRATASADEYVELDAATGAERLLGQLPATTPRLRFLSFIPNQPHLVYLAGGAEAASPAPVRLWNLRDQKVVSTWPDLPNIAFGAKVVLVEVAASAAAAETNVRMVVHDALTGRQELEKSWTEAGSGWHSPKLTFTLDGLTCLVRLTAPGNTEHQVLSVLVATGYVTSRQRGWQPCKLAHVQGVSSLAGFRDDGSSAQFLTWDRAGAEEICRHTLAAQPEFAPASAWERIPGWNPARRDLLIVETRGNASPWRLPEGFVDIASGTAVPRREFWCWDFRNSESRLVDWCPGTGNLRWLRLLPRYDQAVLAWQEGSGLEIHRVALTGMTPWSPWSCLLLGGGAGLAAFLLCRVLLRPRFHLPLPA